jgi:hypothetical protein
MPMKNVNLVTNCLQLVALIGLLAACGTTDDASIAEVVGRGASLAQALDACVDDALEPNQSAVAAVSLPLGSPQQAVSCPANVDFYSFQGPAPGQPFTVSLVFQSDDFDSGTDTGDLDALLRDQAGNLLFIGDREAKDNEFLPAVSDGGVYSLEVQSAQRRVPYTIAVTEGRLRCGILDDAREPNQGFSEASALGTTQVDGYICRGDSDFFRVQGPPAGQLLAIDLGFTPVRGYLGVRVYDRDGERVGSEYFSSEPLVTRRINSDGGVYYVEVFGFSKYSGNYQLQARAEAPSCGVSEDAFEPNDSAPTATPFLFASTIDGFMCQGGRDFYRFTGPPTGTPFQLVADVTNVVALRVSDADGHTSYGASHFRGGVVDLVSDGRDYTVAVSNVTTFDPSDAGYTLTLGYPEPNTSCDLARDLQPLAAACKVANAGPIEALTLSASPNPLLATSRSYVLRLAPAVDPSTGSTVYGGTAMFTAAETASYALFTGSPGIPLSLSEAGVPVGYACSQSFGINECNKLLRGSRYELEAGKVYQLTIGPVLALAPPSVRLGFERVADFPGPPVCKTLRNLESTCETAGADIETVAGAPLGSSPDVTVEQNVSYGVRLAPDSGGNSGAVSFTPPISGEYVAYLSSNVSFSVWQGASEVPASCSSGIGSDVCAVLRRANTFTLSGGTSYRLEIGPTTPQSYIRLLMRPNIELAGECDLDSLVSLESVCNADPDDTVVADLTTGLDYSLQRAQAANVKLRSTETAFRGELSYYTSDRTTFAIYAGSAGVPVALEELGGRHYLEPVCTARLPSSSCPRYKSVQVYRTASYRLLDVKLGPSSPQSWVRLAVGDETPSVVTP